VYGPLIRRLRNCPKSEKGDGRCPELERGEQFLMLRSPGEQSDVPACAIMLDFIEFPEHPLWGLDAVVGKTSLSRVEFLEASTPQI
jgi:hypothetical protein